MVKEKLNDQADKPIATKVIIKFLFFLIFTLNNFIFSSINYLQIKGCTMGTICAPSCANIFMGKFEKTDIYPYIRENKITCFWYIDDLFFIWKGTEGELLSFLENLNEKHPSINFDFKYSKIEIEFLDTKIYKDTNGKLCLTIYHKPTDCQNYLNFKSSHFEHLYWKLMNWSLSKAPLPKNLNRWSIQPAQSSETIDKKKEMSTQIPLVMTYNQTLPLKNYLVTTRAS